MLKPTRALVLTIVAFGLTASEIEGPSAQSQTRPILIKGGTVITVTRGTIDNGSVLLRDGRIEAVGRDIPEPPDAEIVDATGLFVTPGIIDAHTHIAADSINESGTTVSSMTGIEDVLDPTDINIYRDLAGDLQERGVAVVVSLDYPTRPETLGPDAYEPSRVVRQRENAPAIAAALARAGVRFAFQSNGLDEPLDFLDNASRAVSAGLPADAAVRALTIDDNEEDSS